MERQILHSDFNGFFASVECLLDPSLKSRPIAVAGDPERRHGIILAKNELAKKYGIKTAEPIWQARSKCPRLLIVPPHYEEYARLSRAAFKIYSDYSHRVEPFGIDEGWIDVSHPGQTIEDGKRIADEVRERVRAELGITVSVGVATNKIFAKLASDLKKPNATSVISNANFKDVAWTLPASALLFVGNATERRLRSYGIFTIGHIARTPKPLLISMLGKTGGTLYNYANGLDDSEVKPLDYSRAAKSIGHQYTLPHDITTDEEIATAFFLIAEEVGFRLRSGGFRCSVLKISVRDNQMHSTEKQMKLEVPTNVTSELAALSMQLFLKGFRKTGFSLLPVRCLGIQAAALQDVNAPVQTSLFDSVGAMRRDKHELADSVCDSLQIKYGRTLITRASLIKSPVSNRKD